MLYNFFKKIFSATDTYCSFNGISFLLLMEFFSYLTKVKYMNLSPQLLIILKNVLISAPRHLAIFAAHGNPPHHGPWWFACIHKPCRHRLPLHFTWAPWAIYGAREDERLVMKFPEPCCLGLHSSSRNKAMGRKMQLFRCFLTYTKETSLYFYAGTHFKTSQLEST